MIVIAPLLIGFVIVLIIVVVIVVIVAHHTHFSIFRVPLLE